MANCFEAASWAPTETGPMRAAAIASIANLPFIPPPVLRRLTIFSVAHVLFQQRVMAFGRDCEGTRAARLCKAECTEPGSDIRRNRPRASLEPPQPIKIVRGRVRIHDYSAARHGLRSHASGVPVS